MSVRRRPSIGFVLVALISVNVIGIGLSEIQRRALVTQSIESQREVLYEVRALKEAMQRQSWYDGQLTRVLALVLLPGTTAERRAAVADAAEALQRDAKRAQHAGELRAALNKYYITKGGFPGPFPDNSVEDLKAPLVGGGYLDAIPHDPSPSNQYRYTNEKGGTRYGLRIPLDDGSFCITGVGFEGKGWWGNLKECPF